MLSPLLRDHLRVRWRLARARQDARWWPTFPGVNPAKPLHICQINQNIQAAAEVARIDRRVAVHTLRCNLAAYLVEQKVHIRSILVLLEHKNLETTALYDQVAIDVLPEIGCPLKTVRSI